MTEGRVKGGRNRQAGMSAEDRKKFASAGAEARWGGTFTVTTLETVRRTYEVRSSDAAKCLATMETTQSRPKTETVEKRDVVSVVKA